MSHMPLGRKAATRVDVSKLVQPVCTCAPRLSRDWRLGEPNMRAEPQGEAARCWLWKRAAALWIGPRESVCAWPHAPNCAQRWRAAQQSSRTSTSARVLSKLKPALPNTVGGEAPHLGATIAAGWYRTAAPETTRGPRRRDRSQMGPGARAQSEGGSTPRSTSPSRARRATVKGP